MKRYCKNINILDIDFLTVCISDCLRKKWKRRDVLYYFIELTKLPKRKVKELIISDKKFLVSKAVEQVRQELATRKLKLPTTWYKKKVDKSNCKIRVVGIQNIKQQLFDYVGVYGLSDLFKRFGEFQCASIPGRGPLWGVNHIRKWLKNKNSKYFVKLDVTKCFPSIPHDKLFALIDKYVANDNLKWLVCKLVGTMVEGLSIGSYLSQYLCNFYISQLYHEIKENMFYFRRGKRIGLVKHCLIYMDDILLIGVNASKLLQAVLRIVSYAKNELGLTIKPKWQITKITDTSFIDIMGFRIHRKIITVRKRVFLRLRRAYKRAITRKITIRLARKCSSYKGYVDHSNLIKFAHKYKVYKTARIAKKVISNASKVQFRAA